MSQRATLDGLPLFAKDSEIARAVLGPDASAWTAMLPLLERDGLPKPDPVVGKRYVPAVKRYFDKRAGLTQDRGAGSALDGVEDLTAWRKPRR